MRWAAYKKQLRRDSCEKADDLPVHGAGACAELHRALAVTYDGLWEKMQLQLVGNGLKGSASLSAQGSADWVKVINGLFADTTLEFRGIQSDNQKQYQAYFLARRGAAGADAAVFGRGKLGAVQRSAGDGEAALFRARRT